MNKPSNFITHSAYASLKNDDTATIAVTVTNGTNIASGATATFTSGPVAVGETSAHVRARVTTTNYPGRWLVGATLIDHIEITVPALGFVDNQNIYITLRRVSATEMAAQCSITNLAPNTLVITGASQTITFYVNTFLSPLESMRT